MDRGSSSTLFDVVARLRSGESASSRDLDEACREARVLIDQLRALESREEAMLGRLRERDVALAELRASAEATRVETASLAPGGEMAPAVAEDLWSEPPDVRAWGEEGSALLDSGGEAAARALTLVATAVKGLGPRAVVAARAMMRSRSRIWLPATAIKVEWNKCRICSLLHC